MMVLFSPPLTNVNKGLLMLSLTPTVPPLFSVVLILLLFIRKSSFSTGRKICLYLPKTRVGPQSQTRCLRHQNSAPLVLAPAPIQMEAIPITIIHGLRLFGMANYGGVRLTKPFLFFRKEAVICGFLMVMMPQNFRMHFLTVLATQEAGGFAM